MSNRTQKLKEQTRDILRKTVSVVIPVLAYGIYGYLNQETKRREKQAIVYEYRPEESLYGRAANSITNSSMFSDDKAKALKWLAVDKDDSYYEAVISIVNSSMFSNDKAKAIRALSE